MKAAASDKRRRRFPAVWPVRTRSYFFAPWFLTALIFAAIASWSPR